MRLGTNHFAGNKAQFERVVGHVAKADPDFLLRIRAHMALLGDKKTDKAHIAAVGTFLKDKDMAVRMEAARRHWGASGRTLLTSLNAPIGGFSDPDPNFALACVIAVGRMETDARPALGNLEKLAADKESA